MRKTEQNGNSDEGESVLMTPITAVSDPLPPDPGNPGNRKFLQKYLAPPLPPRRQNL